LVSSWADLMANVESGILAPFQGIDHTQEFRRHRR
jgi:hypothetical protein